MQLVHGPYICGLCMTYIWPIYDPTFIYSKFSTFTSTQVFEHAHMCSETDYKSDQEGFSVAGRRARSKDTEKKSE